MKRINLLLIWSYFVLSGCSYASTSGDLALNLDKLSVKDVNTVQKIVSKLALVVNEKQKSGTLLKMTFNDVYKPLNAAQTEFLKKLQALDAKEVGIKLPYRGIAKGNETFIKITDQKIMVKGKEEYLPVKYLPTEVYKRNQAMMDAMYRNIGKKLYVESGYRSSGYQLYVFLRHLKDHNYSIKETAQFVALPGYSEHGCPQFQAIDYVSIDGIGSDSEPEKFEALQEYQWMLKNAQMFGFFLSYPKNSEAGISFEPWHWHYESKK